MTTFEQFKASGADCADLGKALDIDYLQGAAGRVYMDGLYIERWTDGPHPWFVTIENTSPSGDLETVERALYDWAMSAGYGDDDSDEAAAECARNGHRDTGRGVCAECGEFL